VWSVILAGGNGSRLMGAVVDGRVVDRPKQFLRFGRGASLLHMTLARAASTTPPSRLVPVVANDHRDWWRLDLGRVPGGNILVQPANRGTAVAILQALLHILRHDDDPMIVVHPCDHGVEQEAPLLEALDQAIGTASRSRDDLVMIGASPGHPETEYGWILPEAGDAADVRRVRGFVEKPPIGVATRLLRQGALWNTFLLAASGRALLGLFRRSLPWLVGTCVGRMPRTGWRADSLARLYASLPVLDFSRDVLERSIDRLRVARMHSCGWTDLGTPARLESWLARRRPVPSFASVRDSRLAASRSG
jgi:mannose-1-phosphate guanylyltransferase